MSTDPKDTLEMPDMAGRQRIIREYQHIAVVGFSIKPSRPSYEVAAYLQAAGYDLTLINPRYAGQTILGKRIYASLIEARKAGVIVEIVDVFRKPQDLEPVLQEAIQVGARVLWLQLDIRNDEIGRRAIAAGIEFVQDHCTKIEHARLIGANTRWD